MKKILTLLAVIFFACTPAKAPEPEPYDPYEPCPLLLTKKTVQDQCCYKACRAKSAKQEAFKRCASEVYREEQCSLQRQTIIDGGFITCRCQ